MAKVLICDDCPFNIVAIAGLLDQFSISYESCDDGLKAYEIVKQRLVRG